MMVCDGICVDDGFSRANVVYFVGLPHLLSWKLGLNLGIHDDSHED